MRFAYGLIFAALAVASAASAETLTNRSIVALHANGFDAETIIAKIHASDAKFDLSTQQMIALKKQGIPGSVIAAMVAADDHSNEGATAPSRERFGAGKPLVANAYAASRPAGIYLLSEGQLIRLDFNVSGQTKTSGLLGTMLTSGIAATSIKTILQGDSARVKTREVSPTFYFYLPGAVTQANTSSFEAQEGPPTSPNQFSLIRLTVKNGSREARVGRANIGGVKSGVIEKDRIDFQYDEPRPGVFAVRLANPLAPGEYSFVMIGSGGARVARFFDFSIQP